jgi:hypothetical protein
MATKPTDKNRSDDGAPTVNPEIRKSIDRSYDPDLEGSSPLETTSVKVDQERNLWPIIWAVTTIVMVLLTIYLLWG